MNFEELKDKFVAWYLDSPATVWVVAVIVVLVLLGIFGDSSFMDWEQVKLDGQ